MKASTSTHHRPLLLPAGSPRRWLALTISFLLFSTQSALAYQPEKQFWETRNKNIEAKNRQQFDLAQNVAPLLPGSLNPSALQNSPSLNQLPSAKKETLLAALRTIPHRLGQVRDVFPAEGPEKGSVVFIQDVHALEEAQANIAETISWINHNTGISVLALEGSSTPLPRTSLLTFPDPDALNNAAVQMMSAHLLSGAIVGYLSARSPSLKIWGVETASLYQDNVNALKNTREMAQAFQSAVQEWEDTLIRQKEKIFSPQLNEIDSIFEEYHKGGNDLARAALPLKKLLASSKTTRGASFPSFAGFIQAVELENKIDFQQAEAEGKIFLETLAKKLDNKGSIRLLDLASGLRLGSISLNQFQIEVLALAQKNNLGLESFPHYKRYNDYIQVMSRVDGTRLIQEFQHIESQLYEAYSKTKAQKQLSDQLQINRQIKKLSSLSLTSPEWRALSSRVKNIQEDFPEAEFFADFYRAALKRDKAISENLSRMMANAGETRTVLVSGGFHAEGVTQELTRQGFEVIHFVPQINAPEYSHQQEYFSLFDRDQMPVGHLFKGQKLFLALNPLSPAAEMDLINRGSTASANPNIQAWRQQNLSEDVPPSDQAPDTGPAFFQSVNIPGHLAALFGTAGIIGFLHPFGLSGHWLGLFSFAAVFAVAKFIPLRMTVGYGSTFNPAPLTVLTTGLIVMPNTLGIGFLIWVFLRTALILSVGSHEAGHLISARQFDFSRPFSSFFSTFNISKWTSALLHGEELSNVGVFSWNLKRAAALTGGGWLGYLPPLLAGAGLLTVSNLVISFSLFSDILLVGGAGFILTGLLVVLYNLPNPENKSFFTHLPPPNNVWGLNSTQFNPMSLVLKGGQAGSKAKDLSRDTGKKKFSLFFYATLRSLRLRGIEPPFKSAEVGEMERSLYSVLASISSNSEDRVVFHSYFEDEKLVFKAEVPTLPKKAALPRRLFLDFPFEVEGEASNDHTIIYQFKFTYPEGSQGLQDPFLAMVENLNRGKSPQFADDIVLLKSQLESPANSLDKKRWIKAALQVPELFDTAVKAGIDSKSRDIKDALSAWLVAMASNKKISPDSAEVLPEFRRRAVWVLAHNPMSEQAIDYIQNYRQGAGFSYFELHSRPLNDTGWFFQVEQGTDFVKINLVSPSGLGWLLFIIYSLLFHRGNTTLLKNIFEILPKKVHAYISLRPQDKYENDMDDWLQLQRISIGGNATDVLTQRLEDALKIIKKKLPAVVKDPMTFEPGERLKERLKDSSDPDSALYWFQPELKKNQEKAKADLFIPLKGRFLLWPFEFLEEIIHFSGLVLSVGFNVKRAIEMVDWENSRFHPKYGRPHIRLHGFTSNFNDLLSYSFSPFIWFTGAALIYQSVQFTYTPEIGVTLWTWLGAAFLNAGLPGKVIIGFLAFGMCAMAVLHLLEFLADLASFLQGNNPFEEAEEDGGGPSDITKAFSSLLKMIFPRAASHLAANKSDRFNFKQMNSPFDRAVLKTQKAFSAVLRTMAILFSTEQANKGSLRLERVQTMETLLKKKGSRKAPAWFNPYLEWTAGKQDLLPQMGGLHNFGHYLFLQDKMEDNQDLFLGPALTDKSGVLLNDEEIEPYLTPLGWEAYQARFNPDGADRFPSLLKRSGENGFALTLEAFTSETIPQLFDLMGKASAALAAKTWLDNGHGEDFVVLDSDAQPWKAGQAENTAFGMDAFERSLPLALREAHQERLKAETLGHVARYWLVQEARDDLALNNEDTDYLDWALFQFQTGKEAVFPENYVNESPAEKGVRARTTRFLNSSLKKSPLMFAPRADRFLDLFRNNSLSIQTAVNQLKRPIPQTIPSRFDPSQISAPPEPAAPGALSRLARSDGGSAENPANTNVQLSARNEEANSSISEEVNLALNQINLADENAQRAQSENFSKPVALKTDKPSALDPEEAEPQTAFPNQPALPETLFRGSSLENSNRGINLSQSGEIPDNNDRWESANEGKVSVLFSEGYRDSLFSPDLKTKTRPLDNNLTKKDAANFSLTQPGAISSRGPSNIDLSGPARYFDPQAVTSLPAFLFLVSNQLTRIQADLASGKIAPSELSTPLNPQASEADFFSSQPGAFEVDPVSELTLADQSLIALRLYGAQGISPLNPRFEVSPLKGLNQNIPDFINITSLSISDKGILSFTPPPWGVFSRENLSTFIQSGELRSVLESAENKLNRLGFFSKSESAQSEASNSSVVSPLHFSVALESERNPNLSATSLILFESLSSALLSGQGAAGDAQAVLDNLRRSALDDQFSRFLISASLNRLKQSLKNGYGEFPGESAEGKPDQTAVIKTLDEILSGLASAALVFGEALERERQTADRPDAFHPSVQLILLERILIEQGLLPAKRDEVLLKNIYQQETKPGEGEKSRREIFNEEAIHTSPVQEKNAEGAQGFVSERLLEQDFETRSFDSTSEREAEEFRNTLNIRNSFTPSPQSRENYYLTSEPFSALSSQSEPELPSKKLGILSVIEPGQVIDFLYPAFSALNNLFDLVKNQIIKEVNLIFGFIEKLPVFNALASSFQTGLSVFPASGGALIIQSVSQIGNQDLASDYSVDTLENGKTSESKPAEPLTNPQEVKPDAAILAGTIIRGAEEFRRLAQKQGSVDIQLIFNLLPHFVKLTAREHHERNALYSLGPAQWTEFKKELEEQLTGRVNDGNLTLAEAKFLSAWIFDVGGPAVNIERAIGDKNPVVILSAETSAEGVLEAKHLWDLLTRIKKDQKIYLIGSDRQKDLVMSHLEPHTDRTQFIASRKEKHPIQATDQGKVLRADFVAETLLTHFKKAKTDDMKNLTIIIPAGMAVQGLTSTNGIVDNTLNSLHWVLQDLLFGLPLTRGQLEKVEEFAQTLIHA